MPEGKTKVELGFPIKDKFIGIKTEIPEKVHILGTELTFKAFLVLVALGLGVFVTALLLLYYATRKKAAKKSTGESQSLQG